MNRHSLPAASALVQSLLLLLSIMVTMTGCLGLAPPLPAVQDESLVAGKPCLPPCWQGIMPNQTTVSEAVDIIGSLHFVDPESVSQRQEDLPQDIDEAIDWRYKGTTTSAQGGTLYVRNGVIKRMRVILPRGLNLSAVLEGQGEPEMVNVVEGLAHLETPAYYVGFFYPERGLMLSSSGYPRNGEQPKLVLASDITIEEAEYFTPMSLHNYFIDQGASAESASAAAQKFQSWLGMGKQLVAPTPR